MVTRGSEVRQGGRDTKAVVAVKAGEKRGRREYRKGRRRKGRSVKYTETHHKLG